MSKPLELKQTLSLPKTDFPMKASLPRSEPAMLAEWQEKRVYERVLEARKGRPLFLLHDGPPYPTGTIHVGTALNKIVKDMVVKSKSMAGYYAPYLPGWDCHGLPIETKVEKELGGKGKVPPAEFRRLCREFATRYVDQHRRDFKRLGILGQWDDPYLTMSIPYETKIAETFLDFLEKGYVYRGLKPVYWCLHDSTALAEAEVEYEDHTSPTVWIKFPAGPEAATKLGGDVSAAAWTTTPWSLPGTVALAFHPDYDYAVAKTPVGNVLLAAGRLQAMMGDLRLEASVIAGPWKGRELEGLEFRHPFLERNTPAILADYVTLDRGTGVVTTAPGHGTEDFATGQKYGLETYSPLDDRGAFLEGLPEYKGKDVFSANPAIVKLLRDRGMLLGEGKLQHSYPHCWRCHNPVVFRATEQWFIRLEGREPGLAAQSGRAGEDLRKQALAAIKQVKWIPPWGEERMASMIVERPDWCVSRQRFWGVPIIAFTCEGCGKRLENFAALRNVIRWFEKEGADAWYRHPAEELLPRGTKCACGGGKWRKEDDILDVWFDSGSSHLAVLTGEGEWPADVYLEGPDQYRGWFQSSLLIGVGLRGRAPYKGVVTHGWTLDDQGRPMSKSLGNEILPRDICDKWGADLLRLWVASQDYQADTRISERVLTQLSEAYRKIRNTFRFALGNLSDFDPDRDALANEELEEMDRWMLERTAELVKRCREWYDAYEFHRVYHAIHDFAVVDLSAFYFDILKDRLYTFAPRGKGRRSAQTAVWKIAHALVRLITPLLVFTAEEVWRYLPKKKGDPESVHMAVFPETAGFETGLADASKEAWEKLSEVRRSVLVALEQARNSKQIASALESKVLLRSKNGALALLKKYAKQLPALFIVSQVEVAPLDGGTPADSAQPFSVQVFRADGKKCERCWNYSVHVGENKRYPTVCERCTAALEEIEQRVAAS